MSIKILNEGIMLSPQVVAIAEYIKIYAWAVADTGMILGGTYLGYKTIKGAGELIYTGIKNKISPKPVEGGLEKTLKKD